LEKEKLKQNKNWNPHFKPGIILGPSETGYFDAIASCYKK